MSHPPTSAIKKVLRIGSAICVLLVALYFIVPFTWSALKIGIKGMFFQLILDYGFYAALLLGGGGFAWWKIRKLKK